MKYIKAEAKVVLFDNSDVITTSLEGGCYTVTSFKEVGSGPEDNCDSWGQYKKNHGL